MDELAHVEVDVRDGAVVATIRGEVDISNVDDVRRQLDASVDRERARHVVDLSKTEYLDSVGVRLLFSFAGRLRALRRDLHIVAPDSSPVRRVLELTDMCRLIPMHPDLERALG